MQPTVTCHLCTKKVRITRSIINQAMMLVTHNNRRGERCEASNCDLRKNNWIRAQNATLLMYGKDK